ncbi:Aldo/keto reductase [Trametes cingulata]|nr:Aldo/keto reductase [Trametes cingulata]
MVKATKLGGTAKNVVVAKVAHGLMTMTILSPAPVPDKQAFESIKSGIDALPPGVKMMLNSAEFYGYDWTIGNLELLARFFEKYPEYADRTFLSVKANVLRQSLEKSIAALRGTKKIDLFQPARIDPEVSVEEIMRTLVEMVHEGKFDHIGLSECRADTFRRGHVIYPVSVVKIEISSMVYEEETKNRVQKLPVVIVTAVELDIAIAAYSPLAHGMTSGAVKTPQDLPVERRRHARSLQVDDAGARRAFADLALSKGCTPAQLSIAWVGSLPGRESHPSTRFFEEGAHA